MYNEFDLWHFKPISNELKMLFFKKKNREKNELLWTSKTGYKCTLRTEGLKHIPLPRTYSIAKEGLFMRVGSSLFYGSMARIRSISKTLPFRISYSTPQISCTPAKHTWSLIESYIVKKWAEIVYKMKPCAWYMHMILLMHNGWKLDTDNTLPSFNMETSCRKKGDTFPNYQNWGYGIFQIWSIISAWL